MIDLPNQGVSEMKKLKLIEEKIILSKFEIKGLFGEKDISIPFDSNIKILVGENGTGKTTVLNILYYALSGKLYKLQRMPFEELILEFGSDQRVEIIRDEISTKYLKQTYLYSKTKNIPKEVFKDLANSFRNQSHDDFRRSGSFRYLQRNLELPSTHIFRLAQEISTGEDIDLKDQSKKMKRQLDIIKEKFNFEIKYFPTYRRVEEDLRNLGYGQEEILTEETVIQFGMTDVEASKNKITQEIKDISLEWLSKTNGMMLDQLVEGFKVDQEMQNSLRNYERLKVVLDRIGDNIKQSNKRIILSWVEDGVINTPEHNPLVYFLSNLITAYEQQKEIDNTIKEFTEISNRYLVDKKVVYNESSVDIKIVREKNGKEVEMEKLSSGEKQIISLFSKLYLDKSKNIAVFFDEPELSLSIEWQSHLLPDIINSKKCAFLFTTTHSPFIFDNDLKSNTYDLSIYVRER
ncbi:ATP-binding protein [Candidatus Parcubacteria bacterium]|nr:MAG: ATP-binding protein [Candidatus Parcubacteria bacterium]